MLLSRSRRATRKLSDSIPRLRRHAVALAGNVDVADVLVERCLARVRSETDPPSDKPVDVSRIFGLLYESYAEYLSEGIGRRHRPPSVDPEDDAFIHALYALPESERQPLLLVGMEGLTLAEAAAVLKLPPEVVGARLMQAREDMLLSPSQGNRRWRILIVEDEIVTAWDIRRILDDLGHEVVGVAASSTEAVEKAENCRPDLALVDIRLKNGTDGVSAAREMREAFHIPSVFITAHPADFDRTGEIDPYGYVVKPYTPSDLGRVVATALHRLSKRVAAKGTADTPGG